ncbi:HPP family protein [Acidocella aminolytica]|jgi:CBS domain-containing membrane protein|nr:HPP family protein [Acidocella aminolytica]SHF59479.1 HPP family protein [Acidocella aminolytica 101 = DSM 11237]
MSILLRLTSVWQRFLPQTPATSHGEKMRASLGALLGIGLTGLVSTKVAGTPDTLPLLIAPMGASAVLLFAVPASPLAQPWSIMGGNLVAAIIGVTAAHLIAAPLLAASVAISGVLAAMSLLRCVHPPGGAVALTAVLGGPHVLALGYEFALVPVGLNSLLLCLVAIAFNNSTGRSYPHHAHASVHPHPPVRQPVISAAELDEVLADYGENIDISRDDLEALFRELVGRTQRNRVGV